MPPTCRRPAQPARLVRTIAHLRASQIAHRLRLRARRAWWERRPETVAARYRKRARELPPLRFDHPGLARVAALKVARKAPDARRRTAEDVLVGRFAFLNRAEHLGDPIDWHRPDLQVGTRLWKTTLHEFAYAVDLAQAQRETSDARFRARLFELVESWERACPIGHPGFALDSWNARAVVSRMIHWALAGSLLSLRAGEPDAERLGHAIAVHALFLRDNLEWDILGNHLLRDAVGLVFAQELCGSCPEALGLLRTQLDEQLLPDGCHVERAPLYHAIALQDLVETRELLGESAPDWLRASIARMAAFLTYLLHGDGDLPLFGDCWRGEIDPRRLLAEAGEQAPPPRDPECHSGLLAIRRGDTCAVLRAGAHGPDYQLGHAHADLLSFELSRGALRVVTDTGTSVYDAGPERTRLRSTAAHNTLSIDGQEQLEAWDSFRVGRRGRARALRLGSEGCFRWVWASHEAYRPLAGRPVHHRLLAVSEPAVLVLDAVLGAGRHQIASYLHLSPGAAPGAARVLALGGTCARRSAPLHERFGETQEMPELFVEVEVSLPWAGGWLILFGDAADGAEAKLRVEDGVVVAHCRFGDGRSVTARWRPADPAAAAPVEFRLCATAAPTAR